MFTWVVKDFKSLQVRRIQSEDFNVDGCTWSLLLYPNGAEGQNNLSLYLLVSNYQTLPPGWKITAKFFLGLENNSSYIHYHPGGIGGSQKCFDAKAPSWGRSRWLHHSELDHGFLVDGDLKIFAHVEVLHKSAPHEEIDIDDF